MPTVRFRPTLLLILVFAASMNCQAASFKVCTEDADFFPWSLRDGSGLLSILQKMASEKSGVSIETKPMPWRQCLDAVKSGEMNGAWAASYNDERSQFAAYPSDISGVDLSRRLMTEDYVLFRLKGSTVDWDGKKFLNLSGPIGIQSGYSIGKDIRKLGVTTDERDRNSADVMARLLKGEVAAISLLANEAHYLMRQPEIAERVEKIQRPLVQKPYYLIFNKDFYTAHTKDVEALWDAIGAMRESSRYKATERVMLDQ